MANANALKECDSWKYEAPYAPFDPNADDDGNEL